MKPGKVALEAVNVREREFRGDPYGLL